MTGNKSWALIVLLLVLIIVVDSTVIFSKYSRSQSIEISIEPSQELKGEIYIGGEVSNAGFYPLRAGDSVEDLVQAAGGTSANADFSQLKLYIPGSGEEEQPQKINSNRAEAWLLQTLEGIGEIRAKAIIDYRQRNGPFHNTAELLKVEGIGPSTYEKIKHLITVAD